MSFDLFHRGSSVVGSLESLTFESERGDFAVANVRTPTGNVKVIGNLCGALPGERLQIKGRWEHNKQFGWQFRATDVVVLPPTTRKGVIRYLSSGLIEGIGKVLAERLVDTFGENTLDVIENEGHRLLEVPGIGAVRQKQILDAWEKQRAIRQIMLFLSTHSVSTTYAFRIIEEYGERALQVVRDHPYRLARDIFGIGFLSADRIARDMGIPIDAPERLAAGLQWCLEEAASQGHVFLPRTELCQKATQLLKVDLDEVHDVLDRVIAQGGLIEDPTIEAPCAAVYSRASHEAEVELSQQFYRLLTRRADQALDEDLLRRAEKVQRQMGIRLEQSQWRAVQTLLGRPLGVLTGGPGTGKTTIIKVFAEVMRARGERVKLAAPTGRAARRLSEATGCEAETLHRLLGFNFSKRRFERNPDNPLDADLIIVDEASMLDQYLARSFFRAVPWPASVLLVGDADQLPSVGPGNVLQDLLSVPEVISARLTEVFRQEGDSDIVVNAHRIRQGLVPKKSGRSGNRRSDFYHIAVDSPEAAREQVIKLVCERIPEAFGFQPLLEVQVISPMHRGECGIDALNCVLQEHLNPHGEPIRLSEREFRVGDKVIQLRNNYQREVFNGEIGQLVSLDPETGDLVVDFDGRFVEYHRSHLAELALAYCISIHKSQGSEFPAVVVPITTQHHVLLQRNLLYTALTRARQLICIVGQKKALMRAIHNAAPMQRYTGLAFRLQRSCRSA